MSSPAGPPAQPPQVSPDGKWFWDGAQWRPIAVHQAIFPTWQSVGAGLPAEAAAQARSIPSPPPQQQSQPQSRFVAPQAPVYPVAAPAPQVQAPPLWRQPRRSTGLNKYLYAGGGVVGLVVVALVLSSMGAIRFPWQQSPPEQVAAKATPGLAARSDSARADRLITVLLVPPLADLSDSVGQVRVGCQGGMTISCQDALVTVDNQTLGVVAVIDRETIPACIAPQMTLLRADLVKLDADAQLGEKGFKDNRATEVQSAAALIVSRVASTQADTNALTAASKACDTQVTGP